jgi:hypothetical protein
MEIMLGIRARAQLEDAKAKIASLQAKLDKHENEANKRARVQAIPGRPSSSGTVKSKPKSGDILRKTARDAFEDYDGWGDS